MSFKIKADNDWRDIGGLCLKLQCISISCFFLLSFNIMTQKISTSFLLEI